jgi:hypothetical protein
VQSFFPAAGSDPRLTQLPASADAVRDEVKGHEVKGQQNTTTTSADVKDQACDNNRHQLAEGGVNGYTVLPGDNAQNGYAVPQDQRI